MMGRDDQREEREVLDSIFPDEITDISESEWRIAITLELPDGMTPAAEEDDDESPHILHLRVSLPEQYPESAPELELTLPPNAPLIPHFNLALDKPTLLENLGPTIEENLGMAMIFTLVTTLKDNAETLIINRLQAGERAQVEEAQRAEAEENRKFEGEKVTAERFLAWREAFRKNLHEVEERRKETERAELVKKLGSKAVKDEEKKLTGKELWVRGLAGKGEEEEDEGGDGVAEGIKHMKIEV